MIAGPPGQLPDSVRELLRNPREQAARITFLDGTQADGAILRVTDQYVSFREASIQPQPPCDNIDLARIKSVKHLPDSDETWKVFAVIFSPVLAAGVAGVAIHDAVAYRGLPPGSWESVSADPSGRINRLEIEDGYLWNYDVVRKQGRYLVQGSQLHFIYDTEPEQVTSFHFECETMIADRPAGPLRFRVSKMEDRAQPPIVGLWSTPPAGDRVMWDLRPDRTFRSEKIDHRQSGSMQRVKDGFKVAVSGDQWQSRRERDRLFITKNGQTVEYKRSSPVR